MRIGPVVGAPCIRRGHAEKGITKRIFSLARLVPDAVPKYVLATCDRRGPATVANRSRSVCDVCPRGPAAVANRSRSVNFRKT